MELSFIIPTLNEEKILPLNLKQFRQLNGAFGFEVIVADGGSTDKTTNIATELGVKVVVNPNPQTIGSNRNAGASVARGDLLVFCDADTVFENINSFCEQILKVFEDPEVVGAMPRIRVFHQSRIFSDKLYHWILNNSIRLSFKTPFAVGSGQCQIVRRTVFEDLGGYPEKQVHGEDSFLFRRLGRRGKLIYLSNQSILESPRRYRHYGYTKFLGMAGFSWIGQGILGRNVLREWKRVD